MHRSDEVEVMTPLSLNRCRSGPPPFCTGGGAAFQTFRFCRLSSFIWFCHLPLKKRLIRLITVETQAHVNHDARLIDLLCDRVGETEIRRRVEREGERGRGRL